MQTLQSQTKIWEKIEKSSKIEKKQEKFDI